MALIVVVSGCNHYDDIQRSGIVSSQDEESHNEGQNCMTCHHDSKNEASEKWWYVAGTLYEDNAGNNEAKEGLVQLWTGPLATGTLLCSLPLDKEGNFYTQKIIDFQGGYFPIVIYKNDTFPMPEKVTGNFLNESCNSCHGNNANGKNTPVIHVN